MTAAEALKQTPLHERHVAMGARMVPFGGWDMPVQYTGIVDEHQTVRNAAGLFDISHMGEFSVSGPDALAFLQYVTTQDVASIGEGLANYALLCHPDGGIVDDIFIYHLPKSYLVVVNASNINKDFAWMEQHAAKFDVQFKNQSDATSMLALQGPHAEAILARATDADVVNLPFHGVIEATLFGAIPALVARTGYTGEDGFELFVDNGYATQLWDSLLELGRDDGLKAAGLGARDSLRFEPCLALYGHEISDTINPYEAKLGWVVKLAKGEFVGSEALAQIKQTGTERKLVGFEITGRGIARGEYEIRNTEGERIGYVTTGMPSPTLGKNIGLGYVSATYASEGSEFDVVVREKPVRARVVKMPFYKSRYKK